MAWTRLIAVDSCRKDGGTFVEAGGLELAVYRLTPSSSPPADDCEVASPGESQGVSCRHALDPGAGRRGRRGGAVQGPQAARDCAAGEEVFVIDNACPHSSGNLSGGEVQGGIVTCPLHEWKFDLKTGICVQSARARVRRYPAEVREGWVWFDPAAPS